MFKIVITDREDCRTAEDLAVRAATGATERRSQHQNIVAKTGTGVDGPDDFEDGAIEVSNEVTEVAGRRWSPSQW